MAQIPKYQTYDTSKLYNEAIQNYTAAEEKIYEQAVKAAEAEKKRIKQDYDTLRAKTNASARISALGRNEELAAKGLAGNAYDDARSGVSETSRIRGDIALQNDINAAYRDQAAAEQEQDASVIQADLQRQQNIANYTAQAKVDQAKAEAEAKKDQANYELNAWKAQQAAEEFAQKMNQTRQQDAYNNALNELKLFGKVMTRAAAQALGVSIGTTSFEYNKAKKQRKV